jgi:hypothetical protein
MRYNKKADNWGTFERNSVKIMVKNFECWTNPHNLTECDNALRQKVKHCTDIGEVIYKLTTAITAAFDASFQVLRPGKHASKERSVPWWNGELTTLCKKSHCYETEILKDYKRRRPEAEEKAAVPRKQHDISGKITGG